MKRSVSRISAARARTASCAAAALAAAVAYVLSPVDLVPDLLFPIGFADDAVLLAMTWGLVKRELRDYCA
ncbi:MAG TPA: DUF1232 domain-containing protein, partial [Anaeromyxobacter sp.]|nr:DUF1232 domain-containing protein [Anaeromyxobacter sp.]